MTTHYATKADPDRSAGTVKARTIKTVVVDVQAHVSGYEASHADEIILQLNGRTLKRLARHQAIRAGVIDPEGDDL